MYERGILIIGKVRRAPYRDSENVLRKNLTPRMAARFVRSWCKKILPSPNDKPLNSSIFAPARRDVFDISLAFFSVLNHSSHATAE